MPAQPVGARHFLPRKKYRAAPPWRVVAIAMISFLDVELALVAERARKGSAGSSPKSGAEDHHARVAAKKPPCENSSDRPCRERLPLIGGAGRPRRFGGVRGAVAGAGPDGDLLFFVPFAIKPNPLDSALYIIARPV